jgi:hypothetical protein
MTHPDDLLKTLVGWLALVIRLSFACLAAFALGLTHAVTLGLATIAITVATGAAIRVNGMLR